MGRRENLENGEKFRNLGKLLIFRGHIKNMTEIAEHIGISKQMVSRLFNENGSGTTDDTLKKLILLADGFDKGLSVMSTMEVEDRMEAVDRITRAIDNIMADRMDRQKAIEDLLHENALLVQEENEQIEEYRRQLRKLRGE